MFWSNPVPYIMAIVLDVYFRPADNDVVFLALVAFNVAFWLPVARAGDARLERFRRRRARRRRIRRAGGPLRPAARFPCRARDSRIGAGALSSRAAAGVCPAGGPRSLTRSA